VQGGGKAGARAKRRDKALIRSCRALIWYEQNYNGLKKIWLCWGYFVAFTNVLAIYQLYHV
jgi:hypothetical protein